MKRACLFMIAVLIVFSACQKQSEDNKQAETKAMSNKIEIIDPWIRPAAEGTNTALFLKVFNGTEEDDTLFSATSDFAEVAQVHETYKKDDDMMGMREVEYIVIPTGDTIVFKPRDLHIMLINLGKDVLAGNKEEVILRFKNFGSVLVNAEVRDMPKM